MNHDRLYDDDDTKTSDIRKKAYAHQRFTGYAMHGNKKFDVPATQRIEHNLYLGGSMYGYPLPPSFTTVIDFYGFEPWNTSDSTMRVLFPLDDSEAQLLDRETVAALVRLALLRRDSGKVLLHCQVGLNRSGLFMAILLLEGGYVDTPQEAIAYLREVRSPAVLCNPAFERFVLEWGDAS